MSAQDKVILITGTSTGFGRLAVETLARRGHTVYATMRNTGGKNKAHAEAIGELAKSENLKIKVVELDVTDEGSIARAVKTVADDAGRIDVLVNNAGIASLGPVEAFDQSQAERIFATNFFGPFNLSRAVLPYMRAQKTGLLVHVSSGLGRLLIPGFGVYAASKYALEAISETLRLELAGTGVDSVTVEPGAFETPLLGSFVTPANQDIASEYGEVNVTPEKFGASVAEYFSSNESGSPQDVADAIVELIEAAAGSRPTRTPVGADVEPVRRLNEHSNAAQRDLLNGFGFAPFAELVS